MPKIISYTPSWLSRPSAGFDLFCKTKSSTSEPGVGGAARTQNGSRSSSSHVCHQRTIARRGTEIFVVVDNEIRWSDLCLLRDIWQDGQSNSTKRKTTNSKAAFGGAKGEEADYAKDSYRVLKFPIGERIRQLSVSPNGIYLAILTSHTVHVAILPDPSHLGQGNADPIRLKGNTLGPTIHVLSQSPVVRALWHPFGVSGSCLVTITADAAVRVWELNRDNRWSFDSPALAIDLKKLAVGTSSEEDFVPQRIGRNKVFSSDAVGMEVVSACFGGTGSSSESAWSAATLWVAMQDGELYALCPLLPTKWQPSATLLPSLSTAVVSREFQQDERSSDLESRRQRDQYQWISDIDSQDPILIPGATEISPKIEVYNRPLRPGPIPRLQGPFQILPEDSLEELELSDIYVIAAKVDTEELMIGEDSDSDLAPLDEGGLSASVICVVTRSGRIHICLDLDGVEGQWLPSVKPTRALPPPQDFHLVPFELLETTRYTHLPEEWPTFSSDPSSRYSGFTTTSEGVCFFSLEPWLQSLENEFQNTSNTGSAFRINILKNGPGTLREQILNFVEEEESHQAEYVTACVVLEDSDMGYFLLTSIGGQPQAVTLDKPDVELSELLEEDDDYEYKPDETALVIRAARSTYQPPASLWAQSSLPTLVDKQLPRRNTKIWKDEIRFSSATLDLMTEAHLILSQETHNLGLAASDLFRRCERLQLEFGDQIKRASDAAYRIDGVLGKDADQYRVKGENRGEAEEKGNLILQKRLEDAKDRQETLMERHQKLRAKVARARGSLLSEKEELWVGEIGKIWTLVAEPTSEDHDDDNHNDQHSAPWQRFKVAKQLAQELVSHAKKIGEEGLPNHESGSENDSNEYHDRRFNIPVDIRKAKVTQVMDLLNRETTLVDAAQSRLKFLSMESSA